MKYLFAGIVLQLISLSVLSSTVTSKIHSIDKGKNGMPDLILFEDGHTAFMDSKTKSFVSEFEESLYREETLRVKLDKKRNVISVETVSAQNESVPLSLEAPLKRYEPSIVSLSAATSAFQNMRRDWQNNSQCYNRAHIWALEEFNRTGMKTGKLFLFFTSRYIRNYRYKWWFHVTPMAYVGGVSQSNWRTLDRRYTAGPLTSKTWTDVFMHNNATCPVVTKYSSYRNNQQSQDCYLIPTSMYFWQPKDIRRQEQTGAVKTQFIRSEINHAYWEAF